MSGAPDLERSVLEGKERGELHVIAESLGLTPGTRTKKADLIDQILGATGVAGGSSPTPARLERATGQRPDLATGETARASGEAAGEAAGPDPIGANGPDPIGAAARAQVAADSVGSAAAGPDDAGRGRGENPGPAGRRFPGSQPPLPPAGAPTTANGAEAEAAPASLASVHRLDRGTGGVPSESPNRRENGDRPPREWAPSGPQRGNTVGEGDGGGRRRRRRGRDRSAPERERDPGAGERTPAEPAPSGEPLPIQGFLDIREDGFGFVRAAGFTASPRDAYVASAQVKRFGLRKGDFIEGVCRAAGSGEKFPALLRIDTVSGMDIEEARQRRRFEDLTPLFPDHKLNMETPGDPANVTARIVDLMCPIGKGQRGLIVSPPKAGKTTVIKQVAKSIEANNPEVHLIVLLVDERPEEVTDMRRTVKGEVIASTFDRPSDEHTQVAELALERAKRLVEGGRDVVIILDGITRLTRAYNLAAPASGRLTSGGIDQAAIYPPKKFFGAARNAEEGGSLTILATALVETGSKADDVIFEELKGTGNMELRLDRRLAERRLYPAIDVNASSTRHEELLFDRGQLQLVWRLRRVLNGLSEDGTSYKALELLMDKIRTTRTNDEFLAEVARTQMPV